MQKKGKFALALLLIAGIALLWSGALWAQEAPSTSKEVKDTKEPIKIGAVLAVTGPASWLGQPEKNTGLMIVEEINKAGGINGRMIELIVEDDEGNETKAVNAVNKLILKDNVVAIFGPSTTGPSLAVVPIAERHKIPLISCAAAAAITEPIKKYVFKTPQKDSDAAIMILDHIKAKGYKKIAVISEATGFGDQGRKQVLKYAAMPEYGIEIVADETYGPKDTDMTAQLTKIKEKGAEALMNWSIVPAQSIVSQNMKQLEMKIQLYQSHGFGNPKYVKAAGDSAEGVLFPAGRLLVAEELPEDHPQKKVLVEYKKQYEERFKEDVSTFGGHAYDALHLIIQALKKVDDPTRDKIRDEIEKISGFVGTAGIFNFTPEDHTGLTKEAFAMLTVKDGKFALHKE